MKKLRTMLALLLSALMALTVFVGCGTGGDEGSSGGKSNAKKITVWITSVNQPKFFMGWFERAFETANPDIDLKFEVSAKLDSGLDVSLAGKNSPDIASTSGGLVVPILQAGNRVLDLTETVGKFDTDFHSTANLNKTGDSWYCAPIFGFASPVIYYNKTVFKANNLQEPTTYEELVQLCNDIKAIKASDGETQKYQTITTGYTYHLFQGITGKTMTEEQLLDITKDKTSDATNPFDNSGMENAIKWVQQMADDKIFAQNVTGASADGAANDFVQQKTLMIIAPGLDLLSLSESSTFDIGAFILPDAPSTFRQEGVENNTVAGIYNDCFVVSAKTKYPEECKKVIEFMYSEAAQKQLLNCFMYPVVKTTPYDEVDSSVQSLYDSAFKPVYKNAVDNGMTCFWMNYAYKTGLDSASEQIVKGILNGTYSVKYCFDSIKSAW